MTRINQLVRGIGALLFLAALVVGIPWALWHFIGWPLPHGVPSWGQLHRGLDQHGIPDQVLIKALAAVVWITWAVLVVSVVVELPAALSGRSARQLRVVGLFQPMTGRLLAVVIFAVLALAPRAGHQSPGSLAGLASTGANRPVPTMVVNATLADASWPMASSSAPAQPTEDVALAASNPAAAAPTTTYVVQRGDTLWGIAERQLGNPLRWSEILDLNEGRSQPGGLTLTDPHWIDPGWTLILPGSADAAAVGSTLIPTSATATPAPATPVAPIAAPTVPTTVVSPSEPGPTSAAAPTPTIPKITPSARKPATTLLATSSDNQVRLPSGSVIGASFVAGLLSAVALGRLRRRHAYRYSTPKAGVDLVPDPPQPTLRQLVWHPSKDDDQEDVVEKANEGDPIMRPEAVDPCTEHRQDPGRIDFGVRDDASVTIEVTDLSGVAFEGPVIDDVLRALVSALLVHAGPGAAEVALTTTLSESLLPGLPILQALRQTLDTDGVVRVIEAEVIARTRRFDAVDAPDAKTFRDQNPENPLPLLVALVDDVPEESFGRWSAMLKGLPRLGIAVVFLGPNDAADGRLVLDGDRVVTVEGRPEQETCLDGVEAFGLDSGEALELLGAFAESRRECEADELPLIEDTLSVTGVAATNGAVPVEVADDEASQPLVPERHEDERPNDTVAAVAKQWPTTDPVDHATPRAITVQLFGPYGVTAYGQPIETGLRRRSKMLLAWYMLRPDGATSEETIEALWPETDPGEIHKAFWRALGDLRTRLNDPQHDAIEVLSKVGEHYLPVADDIECDLWEFQSALGEASRATDDVEIGSALRRATDAYTGDLLVGSDYPWVEPIRRDLHRRYLDALLRLAEIEDQAGNPERAIAALEEAIEMDRYAEEPYRRLMVLQAARNRPGTVAATWRLLQGRLSALDLEVEDATSRLYHSLTGTETRATRIRPVAKAS